MAVPTIFETCRPRADVLSGDINQADFAADLAQVITGQGSEQYVDPRLFFANTWPTAGLRSLLANVCGRLVGSGDAVSAIFRLDTSYGGGKTHGLIALQHAAQGMAGVADAAEFIDPSLVPGGPVRIAAYDGENATPADGRTMGDGVRARTPWGEIAYALAGRDGFERIRKSDETFIAPGADTLRELFGGEPTLILLDELAVYLRKVRKFDGAGEQLTAFLTSLFKAVESAPRAALVFTLAVGKDGRAMDAYRRESELIATGMAEAESVAARKATVLNPTRDEETVRVLRRRLFEFVDDGAASAVVDAYCDLWRRNRPALADEATHAATADAFRDGYPLHPDVLETLTRKTATLDNFQRVRGMLRLLARTIEHLWKHRPDDATAIHLHHIDPGHRPIREEFTTRLGQQQFVPAISNDIASPSGETALAQRIDAEHFRGYAPHATYVARTIFVHSLAFNEQLKGLSTAHLRYALLSPKMVDISFVDEARRQFVAESAYLDDKPTAPLRFLAEANLTQIIGRQEKNVDLTEARHQLNDRIRGIFGGRTLEPVLFPGMPRDIPDDVGDGRPKLAVMSYDGVAVGGDAVTEVPQLVANLFNHKGSEGKAPRRHRNNVIFVVAERSKVEDMRSRTRRRMALQELKRPERLGELAEHQKDQIRELEARSEQELALAVQQCYRHLFYPSPNQVGSDRARLAHSAIDVESTSDAPGTGQRQVIRQLQALNKLRESVDQPDSPAYVRDNTPLRKGQITTASLRDEFRCNVKLPILIGNDVFLKGVRLGIDGGEYVYCRGELLFGPGDPPADIMVDEQSIIYTMAAAREAGIWPRSDEPPPLPPPPPPPPPPPTPGTTFAAEGVLREALMSVWEQARSAKVERLSSLTVRLFDSVSGFRMLGSIATVSAAARTVKFEGDYETAAGSEFGYTFDGAVDDALPVREFLTAQMRGAPSSRFRTSFELTFSEGLDVTGDVPEKLTDKLTRHVSGSAHVAAEAKEN